MTATVTVSDTFEGFDSSKQTGYVAFTGPAFVKDHTGETIRVGTTKVPLDANGHFTVDLLATDAPGIEPSGWTYSVVVKIGRSINPFSIWLPAANTNVNFRDLAPVASTSGVLAMVPVVESVNGVPPDAAGNVELDAVTSAELATETAARRDGDTANAQAIVDEIARATGAENAKADLVGGVIPAAQLPPLAINDTFPVASQAAMLALTAQRGDVAIRTDLSPAEAFILAADDPTTLANWKQITADAATLAAANAHADAAVAAQHTLDNAAYAAIGSPEKILDQTTEIAPIPAWTGPGTSFLQGDLVTASDPVHTGIWRCGRDHISGSTFTGTTQGNWQPYSARHQDTTNQALLQQEFRRSKGNVIGTGGAGAIAFRFDHWLNTMFATFWPILKGYGWPAGVCVYSRMLDATSQYVDADSTAVTWAMLETECIEQGLEIWSHSETHNDTPGGLNATDVTEGRISHAGIPGLQYEIVQSKADLEAFMPRVKIQGWMNPGCSPRGGNASQYLGFSGIDSRDYDTLAGRMLRQTYAVSESDVSGPFRAIPTGPSHGLAHPAFSDGSLTLAQMEAMVDTVVRQKLGMEIMSHCGFYGTAGKPTTADFTALMAYINNYVQAGKLRIVTPSGLYVADPASTFVLDLIENGVFADGFDPATAPGPWNFVSTSTLVTDQYGTWLRIPNTATTINQSFASGAVKRRGIAGETFQLSCRVRQHSGAVVARYTGQDSDNNSNWNKTYTHTVTAAAGSVGETWTQLITIPRNTVNMTLYFGRSSGGDLDITDIHCRKV